MNASLAPTNIQNKSPLCTPTAQVSQGPGINPCSLSVTMSTLLNTPSSLSLSCEEASIFSIDSRYVEILSASPKSWGFDGVVRISVRMGVLLFSWSRQWLRIVAATHLLEANNEPFNSHCWHIFWKPCHRHLRKQICWQSTDLCFWGIRPIRVSISHGCACPKWGPRRKSVHPPQSSTETQYIQPPCIEYQSFHQFWIYFHYRFLIIWYYRFKFSFLVAFVSKSQNAVDFISWIAGFTMS